MHFGGVELDGDSNIGRHLANLRDRVLDLAQAIQLLWETSAVALALVFLLYTITMILVMLERPGLSALSFIVALVVSLLVYSHFATSHLDISL